MKGSITAGSAGKRRRFPRLSRGSMAAVLGLAVCPLAAHAVSFSGNNWKVDLSGYINAFYTTASCSGSMGGYALAGTALGCNGQDERTVIGNGLLPNALIVKFTTQQQGIDITAQTSLMTSIATGSQINRNASVDVRQAFFTLGTPTFGTVKLGRDYGVFGFNAIINDMTLLGVGMPGMAVQEGGDVGRVSLGHIGGGYTYLGNYSQITYTSPNLAGFSVQAGVFSPVNNSIGVLAGATYDSRTVPQVQAEVTYTAGAFKAWAGAKAQKFYATAAAPPGSPDGLWMSAGEVGGMFSVGPVDLVANVQAGKAIGILTDGDQGDVVGVNYLAQVNYHLTSKLKLGVNYGVSRNTKNPGAGYGQLKSNANVTFGAYYQLTKAVNLDLELGQTRSKDYTGGDVHANSVAVGGMIFF